MASQLYSGTHAVDTTEWSCTTDTAGPDADTTQGEYQLFLDVNDMIAGDILQIRVYEKTRSGDTQRLVQEWILSGAQASPCWASPKLVLMHGWDFTLDALAGTITVLWSVRNADVSISTQAIWDALTSALTTAGSIGKKLADWTIGTAQTGDNFARLGAPAGASVSADVAAIKVDTAAILVDTGTTLDGRIPAALTVDGNMKTDTLRVGGTLQTAGDIPAMITVVDDFVDTEITAIKAKTDSLTFTAAGKVDSNALMLNGDATAAATLAILNGANVVYRGTVTGAATTTTLIDAGLTQADADHFKGRILIFTSGPLTMQATDCTSFTPATDTITFTALTQAPAAAGSYVII